MKRIIAIILCLTLFMAGCTANEPEPTVAATQPPVTQPPATIAPPETEAPETEPPVTEPPAPDTVPGIALANHTEIVIQTADRVDTVDIVADFNDDYYAVKTNVGYGLIEKRLVRLDDATPYERWDGFARSRASFFADYHMLVEEKELSTNTSIQVLDNLGDCLVVLVGETIGYMLESEISRSYIQAYSGGNGGNGGNTGSDGGDISLSYNGSIVNLSTLAPQSGTVAKTGIVLANSAEILLGWFDRDDQIEIIAEEGFAEEKEGWYAVYLDGLCGYVRKNLVQTEDAEPYTEWSGYARSQAAVYDNYYLSGEAIHTLSSNTAVYVICDLGNCYFVSIGEESGYMDKEQVSETYIQYSNSGNGGNGGGEWSDPVL